MSIQEEWQRHVAEGSLHKLEFLIAGRPEKRIVLLSQEVHELVSGEWEDDLMGDRCARLRADLEYILEGGRLTVCWEPFEAGQVHQIGRLHPIADGVWDIRSIESPGLRLFCQFAEKDVLIAFICSPRSIPVPWLNRLPLLGRQSREWRRAIAECKREWVKLFPAHLPHTGECVNDYLSNAFLG